MAGGLRSFILGLTIVSATTCLVLGLTLPIVRLTRFYVWTDVHSLISIVTELYDAHEILLAGVICLFSVVFPFVKLLYLLALYSARHWNPERQGRFLRRLGWLGKWSMLDVLVLALVIFYAKATRLADAVSMPGIYLFAAAVVLTMLAYGIVEYEVERAMMPASHRSGDEEARAAIELAEPQALRPALRGPRAKVG